VIDPGEREGIGDIDRKDAAVGFAGEGGGARRECTRARLAGAHC
jgi:hypothetical protein